MSDRKQNKDEKERDGDSQGKKKRQKMTTEEGDERKIQKRTSKQKSLSFSK